MIKKMFEIGDLVILNKRCVESALPTNYVNLTGTIQSISSYGSTFRYTLSLEGGVSCWIYPEGIDSILES